MTSMAFGRWRLLVLVGGLYSFLGCSAGSAPPAVPRASRQASQESGTGWSRSKRAGRDQQRQAKLETYSARSGAVTSNSTALTAEGAAQRALAIVTDCVEYAPTLVVWLVDISPSAMAWGRVIHHDIRQFYAESAFRWVRKQPDRLESTVWSISRTVETLVPRTSDSAKIVQAFDNLSVEGSGREATFSAVRKALDQYLPVRVDQRREVLFVIVTDEAGDDWTMVDQLVHEPRKNALPIIVIGAPAPFGRFAALDDAVEASGTATIGGGDRTGDSWRPILQGPESRGPERIHLKFSGYDEGLELSDSGFGPFGLERLSRASGGTFLAVRRTDSRDFSFGAERSSWPSPELESPAPGVMWRYRPAPLDAAAYQAQLDHNRACMALHQAAQLPAAEVLRDPQLIFLKRSEADLKNRLDKAQQAAAKVAPSVDKLYELLRAGAADAQQLTEPRWRAGYDLALGRVCAAKARIDGYNSMLAALKRGKLFEDEASTTWVLQHAETCDASSSLRKLIERAKTLLQCVVDEHPGTPWAKVALRELADPMGWEWAEQR